MSVDFLSACVSQTCYRPHRRPWRELRSTHQGMKDSTQVGNGVETVVDVRTSIFLNSTSDNMTESGVQAVTIPKGTIKRIHGHQSENIVSSSSWYQ